MFQFPEDKKMIPMRDITIDVLDMNDVQNFITAVNESNLDDTTKRLLRRTLDRWQNALTLTDELRVKF
jgi:hypothetical protein